MYCACTVEILYNGVLVSISTGSTFSNVTLVLSNGPWWEMGKCYDSVPFDFFQRDACSTFTTGVTRLGDQGKEGDVVLSRRIRVPPQSRPYRCFQGVDSKRCILPRYTWVIFSLLSDGSLVL